jgi:large subunit ribosomal protein L22
MSKPNWEKNYDSISEAKLRHARMSARKARLVCDMIRGRSVADALNILVFANRPSAAPEVLQVLKSARANAEGKFKNVDDLVVSEVFVDGATMMKRTKSAPMGRAVRIRRRTCHITIRLNEA